jgi:acetyltransferase-like isoleucine patch superfamily enzyme
MLPVRRKHMPAKKIAAKKPAKVAKKAKVVAKKTKVAAKKAK